jgi:hypothetical protein
MNFTNFVCWRTDRIEQVMETEALQITDDAVFLATHHPLTMTRRSWMDADDSAEYTEQQFLNDFLKPRDYMFVPVLGEAGTGKSHLIKWLHLNIPASKHRHVILIPKVGTNLRGVIRLILQKFSGGEFDAYRRQLKDSTEHLNVGQAAQKLLDNLAFEVGPNRTGGTASLTENQSYFVESLPALLYDPYFRTRFLSPDGLVHRLAEHVLGQRLTEHRKFESEDLPLNLADLRMASGDAKRVYSEILGSKELQQEAVDWLNSNLDSAVASLLQLRGDKLSNLLLEIRKRLAAERVELVLLIEDFARLEGIENQLLEALLVRSHQGALGELCPLRTAIGCTNGRFKSFVETVRQRTNFVVSLDMLSEPGSSSDRTVDLSTFAARYLNAIRLPNAALNKWYRSIQSDDESPAVPNHCSGCDFRVQCHNAFGERQGFGLYPFTPVSLQHMNERKNSVPFNPRKFVLFVLKHTLENYTNDILTSQFPSEALHRYFGRRLDPLVQDRLRVHDHRNAPRLEALLDLWGDSQTLANLDPGIPRAFGFKEVPDFRAANKAKPTSEFVPVPSRTATVRQPVVTSAQENEEIKIIREWANGTRKLPQDLVNKLRQRLHRHIQHHIDWDSERLKRDYFVGGLWFAPKSLNFHNQVTQASQGSLILTIPEKPTAQAMRDVGLALEAMLRFDDMDTWDFPNGADYLGHFIRLVEQCSASVLARIRRPLDDSNDWNPVPITTQVLALVGILDGVPLENVAQPFSLFTAPKQDNGAHRSKKWRDLRDALANYRPDLNELVLAYIACPKGSGEAQYVDAAQLLAPLAALKKGDWILTIPTAELQDSRFDKLRRTCKRIQDDFDLAIEEEKRTWIEWADRVSKELGESVNHRQLVRDIRSARDLALKAGVLPHVYKQSEFDAAVKGFEAVSVTEAIEAARSVQKQKSRPRLLEFLTQEHGAAMTTTNRFLDEIGPVLEGVTKRLKSDLNAVASGTDTDLIRMKTEISDALESISKDLVKLSGGA